MKIICKNNRYSWHKDSKNKVEKIGIKRSFQEIEKSDIILIIDEKDPRPVYEQIKKNIDKKPFLLIRNKIDLCDVEKQTKTLLEYLVRTPWN